MCSAFTVPQLCHAHGLNVPLDVVPRCGPGMIGVGMMFYSGAALVLRRKFSAKQFIPDIRENNCTVFQVCPHGQGCSAANGETTD